jgi:hypothetical protein
MTRVVKQKIIISVFPVTRQTAISVMFAHFIYFLFLFFHLKKKSPWQSQTMKHERVCVYKPFISYFHPKMTPAPPGE